MILFKKARLMDPASGLDEIGNLLVKDGKIVDHGADVAHGDARIIDCKGAVLCPGFVDMRAHAVDVDAAAKGGITTLILTPDQTTCIDTDAAVERIRARSAAQGSVRVFPIGAATKNLQGEQLAEIGQMKASGAVAFSDANHAIQDGTTLRRVMEYAHFFNALTIQFPLEPSLHRNGIATEGETATKLGLAASPPVAEVIQIERDIRIATLADAPIHFTLVSTRDGVEAIRQAKGKGLRVTCDTSPAYLHFTETALEGYRSFAKLSPPLRREEDRLALIEALGDGTIDCLVSDHAPRSEDVKRLPFSQAAVGAVGFETLLAAGLSPVHGGKVTLMRLIDSLTRAPARLMGLTAGTLAPGSCADLTLFDPDTPWIVDRKKLVSSAKNTPFDTLPLSGAVKGCWVAGVSLYESNHG